MTVLKLYSMPVVRVDGKKRGYILAVMNAGGEILLKCADENEREFFINPRSIVRTGGEIVFDRECKREPHAAPLRLNAPCFDGQGNYRGAFEDCALKNYALKTFLIGGKRYPAERVAAGDVLILRDKSDAPAAIAAKDLFLSAVMS